ncbi:hypothetical protein LDG_5759 [Legionella drancourtii LLAP12]|uniref:Uncharacterized protein n=1 Tax=Legionella drancourtii LLAP12 TaxID=658187 RepID=G9EKM3_9GAMM|nr:hypothetical protein LDG_5759 [Legionella drancourtii LLAP12]
MTDFLNLMAVTPTRHKAGNKDCDIEYQGYNTDCLRVASEIRFV